MRLLAGALVGLALAGCTSAEIKSAAPSSTTPLVTGGPSTPAVRPVELPQLSATAVADGLKRAGYRCGKEAPYLICASGGIEVWLLTGTHKRVPVISLHAKGPTPAAHTAIGTVLPRALETAHVNERQAVSEWYAGLAKSTTGTKTIGDWRVEYSAESGTDEPGVHLTLNDRFCKKNCRAE